MKKTKFQIYVLMCICVSGLYDLAAQDPIYSQFYNTPIMINPAFAGNTSAPVFSSNVRVQWPGIDYAYNTYSLTYDQYFDRLNSGFGLVLLNDSAGNGAVRNSKISGVYSYNIEIGNGSYIKGGMNVSYIQTRLDWDKFVFYDALSVSYGSHSQGGVKFPSAEKIPDFNSVRNFGLGTGFLYYNRKYYVGVSIDNINSPSKGFLSNRESSIIPAIFTLHGGWEFDFGNINGFSALITPNVLFARQGGFTQLNVGAYAEISQLFGGLWYRASEINTDAVIVSFGVRSGMLKIGYSFDYTLSDISIRGGGSHELGIHVNLEQLYPKESKYNDCFQLFR